MEKSAREVMVEKASPARRITVCIEQGAMIDEGFSRVPGLDPNPFFVAEIVADDLWDDDAKVAKWWTDVLAAIKRGPIDG